MKQSAPEYDVEWARGILKAHSLRCTAARVAVLQQLAQADQPLSHADLVASLSTFGFDQSTVFRCLQELSESGVLSRLDLGDQVRRFELRSAGDKQESEHPHFMCVDCGTVTCMQDFSLELSPSRGPRREKLGEITEILLKGHCGTCLVK